MLNKPPPFKGLIIRIPIMIPAKGIGFMDEGFGLVPFAKPGAILGCPSSVTAASWPRPGFFSSDGGRGRRRGYCRVKGWVGP